MRKYVLPSKDDRDNSVDLFDADRKNEQGTMYCVEPLITQEQVEERWAAYRDGSPSDTIDDVIQKYSVEIQKIKTTFPSTKTFFDNDRVKFDFRDNEALYTLDNEEAVLFCDDGIYIVQSRFHIADSMLLVKCKPYCVMFISACITTGSVYISIMPINNKKYSRLCEARKLYHQQFIAESQQRDIIVVIEGGICHNVYNVPDEVCYIVIDNDIKNDDHLNFCPLVGCLSGNVSIDIQKMKHKYGEEVVNEYTMPEWATYYVCNECGNRFKGSDNM